jgi:hypothetical protein
MEFLKRRRLMLARELLQDPDSLPTLTQVTRAAFPTSVASARFLLRPTTRRRQLYAIAHEPGKRFAFAAPAHDVR